MFYEGTKKRISVSRGGVKQEQNQIDASQGYLNFRDEIATAIEQALSQDLSADEVKKVLWLKARINIEL